MQTRTVPLRACKLCACPNPKSWRKSSIPATLTSADFAITDNRYGLTFALHKCVRCGFLQTFEGDDAEGYYRGLVDTAYAEGYSYRKLQFRSFLELSLRDLPPGLLFDIGAANGTLLEQAALLGYRVEGIEPSEWLCQQASQRGLALRCGAFPDPRCPGPYDVITAIDVLEHVADPLAMLAAIREALGPKGRAIIVTPDVSSLAAQLLRRRWWHFRIAHLSYFNRRTLLASLEAAGLAPVRFHRPAWVFSGEYLWQRLAGYFPCLKRVGLPAWCGRWMVRINFFDSWLVIVERKGSDAG
jgi:SAM-dependent methyltransferase